MPLAEFLQIDLNPYKLMHYLAPYAVHGCQTTRTKKSSKKRVQN